MSNLYEFLNSTISAAAEQKAPAGSLGALFRTKTATMSDAFQPDRNLLHHHADWDPRPAKGSSSKDPAGSGFVRPVATGSSWIGPLFQQDLIAGDGNPFHFRFP